VSLCNYYIQTSPAYILCLLRLILPVIAGYKQKELPERYSKVTLISKVKLSNNFYIEKVKKGTQVSVQALKILVEKRRRELISFVEYMEELTLSQHYCMLVLL
jgi:hypothetical protein